MFFFLSRMKAEFNSTRNSKDITTFTKILDSLLDGYDNRLRPGLGGSQTHRVLVLVVPVGTISLDLFLSQKTLC